MGFIRVFNKNPTDVILASEEIPRKTGFNWNVEEFEKSKSIWLRYQYKNSGLFLRFDKTKKTLTIGKFIISNLDYILFNFNNSVI